jgi:hypothetical protein
MNTNSDSTTIFNILLQTITGKHATVLKRVQVYSFVQAWCQLHQELGATNCKRKNQLIANLDKLEYGNDPQKYKTHCDTLTTEIYDADITIEDLLMYKIIAGVPHDLVGLKVLMTKEMEKVDKSPIDVRNFTQTVTTTLELADNHSHSPHEVNTALSSDICNRCGGSGHKTEACYAWNHTKTGRPLDPSTAAQRPAKGKGKGNRHRNYTDKGGRGKDNSHIDHETDKSEQPKDQIKEITEEAKTAAINQATRLLTQLSSF